MNISKKLIPLFGIALFAVAANAQTTEKIELKQKPPIFLESLWRGERRVQNPDQTRIAIVGKTKTKAKAAVSRSNKGNFELGFVFVRASFYAGECAEREDLQNRAIVDIVRLSARFEKQPEIKNALDAVLQSILHQTGTSDERRQGVLSAANLYETRLAGDAKWFYQIGLATTRLHLENYAQNGENVRRELQNLETLAKLAPNDAPKELLEQINNLTVIAAKNSLDAADFMRIEAEIDSLIRLLGAGEAVEKSKY